MSLNPEAAVESGNFVSNLTDWNKKEKAAVALISHIGELLYDKGVELVLFRNHLIDESTSAILNLHDYAEKVVNKPIDIYTTADLAKELLKLDNIKPAKIDIGKLAAEWLEEQNSHG
ncbi:MAG: hypothetical protein MRY83_10435, partial [Flavobacteriales bacterium]|nr:hypothetical protein [Flavobacteriales bacterium]